MFCRTFPLVVERSPWFWGYRRGTFEIESDEDSVPNQVINNGHNKLPPILLTPPRASQ